MPAGNRLNRGYSLTRKGADFQQVLRCEKVGRTILKRESK